MTCRKLITLYKYNIYKLKFYWIREITIANIYILFYYIIYCLNLTKHVLLICNHRRLANKNLVNKKGTFKQNSKNFAVYWTRSVAIGLIWMSPDNGACVRARKLNENEEDINRIHDVYCSRFLLSIRMITLSDVKQERTKQRLIIFLDVYSKVHLFTTWRWYKLLLCYIM